jgi:hypothetical protein
MLKKKSSTTTGRTSTVNYNKSKMAKIRKHFQESGGGGDDRWFNIKAPERGQDAKATIRVLPPWGKSADGFFYYTVGQHFGFSIGGRNRAISCPESIGKGKCPVCVFISRLKNSDNPDHTKLADRIRANRRYFVNVIDREEPDKVKIYGTNKKFVEAILDASDDPDVGDMTDPQSGRDITIVRRGSGLRTRYSYRIRTKESSVDFDAKDLYQLDKEVDEWLSYDAMVEYLQNNFNEELREVGLKFKKSKSKPATSDDDEDEEDDKPVKKGKKMNKKPVDTEDDDDDDVDDDDENDDVEIDDDEDEDEDEEEMNVDSDEDEDDE